MAKNLFSYIAFVLSTLMVPPAWCDTGRTKFDLIDNRIFTDVWINGKGPFRFIFDTGGNNSMTYEMAKKLGLPVKQIGEGSGAGPGKQPMGETKIDVFKVGDIEMKSQEFIVLDYSKIQKAFNFPALDGIFGLEILQKYLTLIDYEKNQISFFSNPEDFKSKGFEKVDFELLFDKPFIKSILNGLQANTLIDTGDRSALTVTKSFRKNSEIGRAFVGKSEVVSGYGIGGPILAKVSIIDHLKISKDLNLKTIVARTPTADGGFNATPKLDASIGNEILKQFTVAFDYRKKAVFFKENKNFGTPTKFSEVPNPQ